MLLTAGIAGILVGVFILTFAVVADGNNIFLFDDVFSGASVEPWIQNVLASPNLSKFIMLLPVAGFSCMFVVAIVLYQYIPENSWQKNLSLAGYAIGVPVAVVVFMSQLSLMNEILLLYGKSPAMDVQLQALSSVRLHFFNLSNLIIAPVFIIICGTGMMAWAALKADALPKWICIWWMVCTVLVFISFGGLWFPVLRIAGLGAPLHMLGFLMAGVILLKRSFAR